MGRKQLLLDTLILKIVERNSLHFQPIIKIHNDLLIICLAYCTVVSWILTEIDALEK